MVLGIIVLVSPVVIVAGWLLQGTTLSVDFTPRKFDSAVWKSTPAEFSWESMRLKMVDDLLARTTLQGMTEAAVVDLLGEPDETPYFDEFDMVYWLGQERHPFGIDSEWLVIRLNDAGVASEARVVRD